MERNSGRELASAVDSLHDGFPRGRSCPEVLLRTRAVIRRGRTPGARAPGAVVRRDGMAAAGLAFVRTISAGTSRGSCVPHRGAKSRPGRTCYSPIVV